MNDPVVVPNLDIVLAEDDPDLAALNREVLEDEGHHVVVAPDGPTAVSAVKSTDPDLLILDIERPRGAGLEVLEAIRAEPSTEDQPVLMVSNTNLSGAESQRLSRLGVIDFLAQWKLRPLLLVGWVRGWAAALNTSRRRGRS